MVFWKLRGSVLAVLLVGCVSAVFLSPAAWSDSPAGTLSKAPIQSTQAKKSPEQLRQEIAELTKKIEAEPKVAKNYGRRGLRYHDLGDYEDALRDFDRAISLDPADGRVHAFKGDTLLALRRVQDAIGQFSLSIEKVPASAETYVRRSVCYQFNNDSQNSLSDALTAAKLDSSSPLVWRHLGFVQLRNRDFRSAKSSLSRAIVLDPSNGEAYFFRAEANSALDLKSEATRDAEKARLLGFVGVRGR